MKRIIWKILVLIFVISLGVFGIGYYYKTKVAPPQKLVFTNKHIEEVKTMSMAFDTLSTDKSRDSLLYIMHDKIELYATEEYVTDVERDELMKVMTDKYVPLFISSCMQKFNQSIWYHKDREWMKEKIAELKSYETNSSMYDLIDYSNMESLDKILNIIQQYNNAWHVSQMKTYKGLSNTREVINQVRKYSQMEYLRNNTKLVADLNAIPKKIEKSHYQMLQNHVALLEDGYLEESKDTYLGRVSNVRSEISVYKENAMSLYGTKSNISALELKLSTYRNEANNYYESQEKKVTSSYKIGYNYRGY